MHGIYAYAYAYLYFIYLLLFINKQYIQYIWSTSRFYDTVQENSYRYEWAPKKIQELPINVFQD